MRLLKQNTSWHVNSVGNQLNGIVRSKHIDLGEKWYSITVLSKTEAPMRPS